MNLFDTHAHLQFEKFDLDRDKVIKRNSEQLVAVINPGAKIDSSEKAVVLASEVKNFYAAVGVHPHHTLEWHSSWLDQLETLAQNPKVVAVGEIGLDNHLYQGYPEPDIKKQTEILLPQIHLAVQLKKPILFHCRKAYDELYNLLKPFSPLQGLMHCFMGNQEEAKKFVDLGLLISFAGNITYKANEDIRRAAEVLPMEKILLETDSPYLAPEPLRGSRNEPVNVAYVAKTIATIKKVNVETIADVTTNNAKTLFNL